MPATALHETTTMPCTATPLRPALAAAFTSTGGLIDAEELSALLCGHIQQPMSHVARWIAGRTAVVLAVPEGWLFPLFQFDTQRVLLRSGVLQLLGELQGTMSELDVALWFVRPHLRLQGALPALALRNALPSVLQAAREDRARALGAPTNRQTRATEAPSFAQVLVPEPYRRRGDAACTAPA